MTYVTVACVIYSASSSVYVIALLHCQWPLAMLHTWKVIPEWHHNRFSCSCRTHSPDRQRDRPHYSVCSNRPHL